MHFVKFEKYLLLEKHYSKHTCDAYLRDLSQLESFLQDYDLTIENVTYPFIRQWMATLMDQGLSSKSINRKMSSLKTFFKYLRIQGVIDKDVMASHKSLKTPKTVQVPFSQSEVKKLLNDAYDHANYHEVRDRLIIELLYVTGMRRAELVGLTTADVDCSLQQIKVHGKRNKQRYIPLLKESIDLLRLYVKLKESLNLSVSSNAFILTDKGNPVYPSFIYRVVSGYFKKISLKVKVSPHVLRHSFATHLLDQGADINAVKELLGHASLASTQVYTHTSMQALKLVHSRAHPRNNKL